MKILYCICCLSTSGPFNNFTKDSILRILYNVLLGYTSEDQQDYNYHLLCKTCEYFLHKVYSFHNMCRASDVFMREYKIKNGTDVYDPQVLGVINQKAAPKFQQLKCSATQNIDIPSEDRLLIRRRPVSVITLSEPESALSNVHNKECNQIVLSIKNPVDVEDEEEYQSAAEDTTQETVDKDGTDEDSIFDFTIVVKNDPEKDPSQIIKTAANNADEYSASAINYETQDDISHKQIHSNDSSVNQIYRKDSDVIIKPKNNSISLFLNAFGDIQLSHNEDKKSVEKTIISTEQLMSSLDSSNNVDSLKIKQEEFEDQACDYEDIAESDAEDMRFIKDEITKMMTEGKPNIVAEHILDAKKLRKIGFNRKKKSNVSDRNNTNKKRFRCEICGLVFDLAIHLEIHNSTHTGIDNFICDLCCRTFRLKSTLAKHMARHSCDRKKYKCDLCPKTFILKKLLYKHKFKHTNENKPHVCGICSRGFVFENELKKHMLLHTNIRPFSCTKCPKKFTQKGFLSQHLLTHVEGELFICDICGKGFAQNAKLSYHRKTHLEVKPFQCDMCPRSFVRSGQLKSHKIYHSNERPWICEHCGRSFRVKGALTAHERVHSGARPYKCDICNHSYTEAGYLKKHKRIHSGIKPFSCEICGRAFNETCTLARHRLTHTDERKLVCQECGGRFKYTGCLNKHIQKKHNPARLQQASAS